MDLVGIPVDICAEYPFGAVVVARACRLRRHAWSLAVGSGLGR
jgi:hypothetical protein